MSGSAVLGMLDAHAERTGAVAMVLDHHTAEGGGARWAGRIVNPQATPAGAPHRGLCTGALAWFLARALAARHGVDVAAPHQARWSALAGLALVCDVMPMGPGQTLGRALVAESFAAGHEAGPAVEALLGLAGRAGCALDWWDWAFRVGPRLNAGSRMGESALAARALRSRDPHDAADAAQALHAHNEARKAAGRTLDTAATAFARVRGRAPVLVAALDEATAGIAGIAASRLVERFGWPAVVLGRHPAGGWSGSGRSALGFDLGGAVAAGVAAGAIAGGGGHAAACGLRVADGGVEEGAAVARGEVRGRARRRPARATCRGGARGRGRGAGRARAHRRGVQALGAVGTGLACARARRDGARGAVLHAPQRARVHDARRRRPHRRGDLVAGAAELEGGAAQRAAARHRAHRHRRAAGLRGSATPADRGRRAVAGPLRMDDDERGRTDEVHHGPTGHAHRQAHHPPHAMRGGGRAQPRRPRRHEPSRTRRWPGTRAR